MRVITMSLYAPKHCYSSLTPNIPGLIGFPTKFVLYNKLRVETDWVALFVGGRDDNFTGLLFLTS